MSFVVVMFGLESVVDGGPGDAVSRMLQVAPERGVVPAAGEKHLAGKSTN